MRRILLALPLVLLLAACGGGGFKQRVNPPVVSVQELRQQADGQWNLQLRVQSYSNVTMRIEQIDAVLEIDGVEAARIALAPALDVAPGAEVIGYVLQPGTEAAARVRSALEARGSVPYSMRGTIRSSRPGNRRDDFNHHSQLSAVPGLTGVMR